MVRDDLDSLITVLPEGLRQKLLDHPNRNQLLEVSWTLSETMLSATCNFGPALCAGHP